jgi:hypothetical protein
MKKEEIPSAEELLKNNLLPIEDNYDMSEDEKRIIIKTLKEFAKLHVQKALERVHNNMQFPIEDLEFTLEAYPLDLIK